MKWDTSELNSLKEGNELFNDFTTTLNKLCKPLNILFADSSATLHSLCAFLIWSHIINL